MEKNVLIVIAIVAVIFVAAIVALAALTLGSGAGIQHCGNNVTCFYDAIKANKPADVTITKSQNGVSTSVYSKFSGCKDNMCNVYYKITKIEFPAGMPSELANIAKQMLENKDATCNMPKNEIQEETIESSVFKQYCKGSLVDAISRLP